MAYNKKTWISNEIITSAALNNIEEGIAELYVNLENLSIDIDYDSLLAFNTQELVIGYIDDDYNIILNNDLSYGLYILKYEHEDGSQTEVQRIFLKNPDTNLLDIGEVYLNQRYSQSGGGLVTDSTSTGMYALIVPLDTDGNIVYTLRLRLPSISTPLTQNGHTLYTVDSNKANPGVHNGSNNISLMTKNIKIFDDGKSADIEFKPPADKKYLVINIDAKESMITADDIADHVMKLEETYIDDWIVPMPEGAVNLLETGEVELNKRYSKTKGGLSDSKGTVSLIFPIEADGTTTHTLTFRNLPKRLDASTESVSYLLGANKEYLASMNGADNFNIMTTGITLTDYDRGAVVEFTPTSDVKYVAVSFYTGSTAITAEAIKNCTITLDEE